MTLFVNMGAFGFSPAPEYRPFRTENRAYPPGFGMRIANLTRRNLRLVSALRLRQIMMKFRLSILLVALLSTAAVASADQSLLDKSKTRPLTAEEQPMFGPKSHGLHYDARMIRAAEIARKRAHPHMTWHCWAYVKDALVAANVISSRPTSAWARQAADELTRNYGFKQLPISNPMKAPVGAVIVYGGPDAGHVELRTEHGFVSDFISTSPYPRPVIGIFVKPA